VYPEWYNLRWRLVDWHRVLKTGAALKRYGMRRRIRAIAINTAIAIILMTLLGRETPDLLAAVLFSDVELRLLAASATTASCGRQPTCRTASYVVGKMGGYMGRSKHGPPPGHQLMFHGSSCSHLTQGRSRAALRAWCVLKDALF
jgi:hypothetical protein